jgi:hypothetical protein
VQSAPLVTLRTESNPQSESSRWACGVTECFNISDHGFCGDRNRRWDEDCGGWMRANLVKEELGECRARRPIPFVLHHPGTCLTCKEWIKESDDPTPRLEP